MNICSKCLFKQGVLVQYPGLLKVYDGCSVCKEDTKKAWRVSEVERQVRLMK